MKKILIWGASGHALVVADILKLRGEYEIVGFMDDVGEGTADEFNGLPVFHGREKLIELYRESVHYVIIAFGQCAARLKAADFARSQGFKLATAVHPMAIIADDVTIGEGTVIAAGAVVNPAARIGANVIINTSASVDHEVVIADGAHICPGVRLAGRVFVGEGAWVGIGSSVVDRVKIGNGAFIGAGSVVVDDIPSDSLAYGVPAKVKERVKP
ncbi:MAG: sugar acetyltransferase [Geobacteraceae bacterium GWC2_48_7]|nr:MAG: sugar acetyltransferase [Geobacteraceae bacterium GWC2_48_7]